MSAIKGCTSVAEYAIRKWMQTQNFVESAFTLTMSGNMGTIRDRNGDTLTLVYNNNEKVVYVQDQEAEL